MPLQHTVKNSLLSTGEAPSHKLDTLLNPDKAAQYLSNKEKAMEDIRAAWQKVVIVIKSVFVRNTLPLAFINVNLLFFTE